MTLRRAGVSSWGRRRWTDERGRMRQEKKRKGGGWGKGGIIYRGVLGGQALGLASRGLAPEGCRLVPSRKTGTLDRCIVTSHGRQRLTTGDVGYKRRHVERHQGRRLSEPRLPGIKLDPSHARLVCKVELRLTILLSHGGWSG